MSFLRSLLLCVVVAAGLVSPVTSANAQYSIDYVISPYKPALLDSWFFGINNRGQATGYALTRNEQGALVQSAVTYHRGDLQALGSGDYTNYYANTGFAINNHGAVIGNLNNQPTLFTADHVQIPIIIPGFTVDVTSSLPGLRGINDFGTVLVNGYLGLPADVSERYGYWNTREFRALSILDPLYPNVLPPDPNDYNSGPWSFAYSQGATGLNNSRQFASGVRQFNYDPGDPSDPNDDTYSDQFIHAFVFNGRDRYHLLQSPEPGDELMPIGIDQRGSVFGWAGARLAIWNLDGRLLSVLPDPPTPIRPFGFGAFPTVQRNNLGQVVAITSAGIALYDPQSGVWTDITSSIAGLDSGSFHTIQGFNDRGEFVGLATPPLHPTGVFAYVVSPTRR